MGKATIGSYVTNGLYDVTINYGGRSRVNQEIADLDIEIAALETKIAAMEEGQEKEVARLILASKQKQKEYLQTKMPPDYSREAYCADATKDLSGEVGTIEIPGEDQFVAIQPGYGGNAVYTGARDGSYWPIVAGTPAWAFLNMAILPGWQKWKPTYRYATIMTDSIDYVNNLCAVVFDPAVSSQQSLNVNQGDSSSVAYEQIPVGDGGTSWQDFKSRYPAHPLSTNEEIADSWYPLNQSQYLQIRAINDYVNLNYSYKSDASGISVGDKWDIMGPSGSGDCEDFALTKADKLINELGISPKYCQLSMVRAYNSDHAVLVIPCHLNFQVPGTRWPTSFPKLYDELVLDNGAITMGLVSKSHVMSMGGVSFINHYSNKDIWSGFGTWQGDIPIEYMSCNAAAFVAGDRVIVKFDNQNWENPRVIGFATDPKECSFLYEFNSFYIDRTYPLKFNISAYTLAKGASAPSLQYRPGGIFDSSKAYLCGQTSPDFLCSYIAANVNQYDALLNSWSVKNSMGNARYAAEGANLESTRGYIYGGWGSCATMWDGFGRLVATDSLESYSYSGNSWTTRQDGDDRVNHCFLNLNSKGYAIEGQQDNSYYTHIGLQYYYIVGNAQHNTREYDPTAGTWTTKQTCPNEMFSLDGFAINNLGYIGCGGFARTPIESGDEDYPGSFGLEYRIANPVWNEESETWDWVTIYWDWDYRTRISYKYNPLTDAFSSIQRFPAYNSPGGSMGTDGVKGYKMGSYGSANRIVYGYTPSADTWANVFEWDNSPPENYRGAGGSFLADIG